VPYVSNQTKKTQDSEYAPKWTRQIADEPGDEPGPDIAEGEQELPVPGYLRRLQPEILNYPERLPRRLGRRFSFTSLVVASVIGAAIVVAVTDTPKWIGALGVGKSLVDSMFRRGDNSSPPAKLAAPQPAPGDVAIGGATTTTRTASLEPTPAAAPQPALGHVAASGATTTTRTTSLEPRPAVQGVTDSEILLGISAPFSGSAKELGSQMKLGIETAFALANDAGGINGRQVKLMAADDGYEPRRTADTMRELYEKQKVLGFIGNVGTPTTEVALPYALEHHALFFGAFTGADLLRRDPPDRYVFNYRASYAEETNAVVRYLVSVRHLRPEQIAVFAQHDAFGDAGFDGVAKAIRSLHGNDEAILRLNYERNTVNVDDAVARLRAHKGAIKAVVMVAVYRPAAHFIEKTRDLYPGMIYTNVSFVGSTALADELMLLGPRFANGVIVTQVVPAIDGYASAVLKYRDALAKYQDGAAPDYVSFEGYVDGSLLLEGLRRAGPQPKTEKLVDGLESIRNFDMGLGTLISLGPSDHQGSHKVWGTQLNLQGRYEPIDLQ
jgi:ABC-type branched-subunit amino acid transport system substrate-binding protein